MAEIIENDGPFYGPEDCQDFTAKAVSAPDARDGLPKVIEVQGADGSWSYYDKRPNSQKEPLTGSTARPHL